MGARLRVFLTSEQNETLLNLRIANVPQKVKDRAEVIRLNAHGWYVERIAAHFNWTPQTVREVLHKWQELGIEGLWELPGRGGKSKWKEEDILFLAVHAIDPQTVVSEWVKTAPEKKTCLFAINVPHSMAIANEFLKHGIRAYHLDGESPRLRKKGCSNSF